MSDPIEWRYLRNGKGNWLHIYLREAVERLEAENATLKPEKRHKIEALYAAAQAEILPQLIESNVIDFASRRRPAPPRFGATVAISAQGAELASFWDDDDSRTPSQRCFLFADALIDLATRLRETGRMIEEP